MPAGAQRFAWRRWGENGVLFDRRYGDTHALSGVLAGVFQAWLATGSTDPALLAQQIEPADAALPTVTAALQELQQRGLLPSP